MAGKAHFNWEDPLLLDQQLTEEERMVRNSAAQFAADKLAPRVLEAFRHEQTDPALFREMGETGLLGATIHDAYGGSGTNSVCYGRITREEIGRASWREGVLHYVWISVAAATI